MTSYTLTKLSKDDLADISGGQKIYCALDPENNQTRYFIPDEIGIFMTYNMTAAIENSPLKWKTKLKKCKDLEDAEKRAWRWVDSIHLFSKKVNSD